MTPIFQIVRQIDFPFFANFANNRFSFSVLNNAINGKKNTMALGFFFRIIEESPYVNSQKTTEIMKKGLVKNPIIDSDTLIGIRNKGNS
jgi:hypothetical protein